MSPHNSTVPALNSQASRIEFALWCARTIGPVFRCARNGKQPMKAGWQKEATTDRATIREWFGSPNPPNIGIATGDTCGVIVVDLDRKDGKNGPEAFIALAEAHGSKVPKTLIVGTPSGGQHLFYRVPAHVAAMTGNVGALGDGIDIRAAGNLVVGAGSTIDGKPYRILYDAPIVDMPEWLIDAFLASKARAEPRKAPEGLELDTSPAVTLTSRYLAHDAPPAVEGSGGDAQTYAVACEVRDMGISEDKALGLIAEHYNPRCSPPWEIDDLAVKVANAYRYGQNSPGVAAINQEFDDLDAEQDAELQLCQELGLDVPQMIRTAAANARARADGDTAAPLVSATPFVWIDPAAIPRRQWLFGKHYIRGYATGTVAPGGTGKTAMTIVEALSMITGRDLIGGDPNPVGLTVWLWNLEDPEVEIRRRIAAAVQHHGINPATLDGKLFVNSGRDTPLVIARKVKDTIKVLEPIVDALVAEIRAKRIDVLTVDPFVSSHSLPENDNAAMDAAVKAWARVAHLGNCAVELVHHSRKLGGEEASAESARGGSAFVDACRGVRVINRMSTDEAAKLGISEPRFFFSMMDDKPNMAPPPTSKRDWFQLVSVFLPNGDEVGAVARWEKPNQLDDVTPEHLARVRALFTEGNYLVNEQSPDWGGRAVASVIGVDIGVGLSAKVRTTEHNGARAKVRAILAMWLKTPGGIKIEPRKNAKRELKDCYAASDDAA